MSISISNSTRRPTPRLPFEALKTQVLGKKFEVSLVFCGDSLSHKLNKTYRKKDYPTNVLAFEIGEDSGEIFINLSRLKGFSVKELFVHALFHLKGMEHGYKMEEAEKQILNGTSNRNRH